MLGCDAAHEFLSQPPAFLPSCIRCGLSLGSSWYCYCVYVICCYLCIDLVYTWLSFVMSCSYVYLYCYFCWIYVEILTLLHSSVVLPRITKHNDHDNNNDNNTTTTTTATTTTTLTLTTTTMNNDQQWTTMTNNDQP